MSKLNTPHVFTSESVGSGHPDKVCDQISDAVLDACLQEDSQSRVACETAVTTDFVLNIGEITCAGWDRIDTEAIARKVVREIGYDRAELLFSADTFKYQSAIHPQVPDIAQGVDATDTKELGAGDQGMMFGYATRSTPALMPAPIYYSHVLLRELEAVRNRKEIPYLRPDAKAQVSILHENGAPQRITSIVLSHQTDDVPLERIQKDIREFCRHTLNGTGLLTEDTEYYINPTGKFVIGGPHGDAGLTGRKIIVDTYGGVGCHGGGAFSGKDPTKVDRSGAYYARYAAKNIVAAGVAEKCEIQVAYAIGIAKPLSIAVDTFGTGTIEDAEIQRLLEHSGIFDFRPASIIDSLSLRTPRGWSYRQTSTYGHFGRDDFPWERLDKVEQIRDETGVAGE